MIGKDDNDIHTANKRRLTELIGQATGKLDTLGMTRCVVWLYLGEGDELIEKGDEDIHTANEMRRKD